MSADSLITGERSAQETCTLRSERGIWKSTILRIATRWVPTLLRARCGAGAATRSDFFRRYQCSISYYSSCVGYSRPKLQRK